MDQAGRERCIRTSGKVKLEACCRTCGGTLPTQELEPVLKRGAVVIAYDPLTITWRGRCVSLSPTEAHVYAFIARRGRATIAEIDRAIEAFGATAATRSLVLGHIRGKFARLGACDPFERIGAHALRLRVDADEQGRAGTVIGLWLPRYVTVLGEVSSDKLNASMVSRHSVPWGQAINRGR